MCATLHLTPHEGNNRFFSEDKLSQEKVNFRQVC